MADTMRRWEMDAIGRDGLTLRTVPIPVPGRHEVLVKVEAVALNHRDKMVTETGRGLNIAFPFTPGSDLAGQVVALGKDVTRFTAGDRVISTITPDWIDGARPGTALNPSYRTLGGHYPGVIAEYVAFPQEWFVRAPTTLNPALACTLPCAGLTAWFALLERGRLRAGQTVLVEGTGGVALFGLQIAKAFGATVIVSASSAKLDRARTMGARHAIDRRREDWVDAVLGVTEGHGVNHVLEIVGGPHLGRAAQVVAVGGRISLIGALEGFDVSAPVAPLLFKDVVIQGIGTGHRRALEDLVRAVDQTGLEPVIDTTYSLYQLPAALDHLERGPFGKVVLDVG
jgi:NADPH:quinone reductase-like Zn-dependent oxidoreductase